ncbi:MAG: hypothetical protein WC464_00835 [Bdellovibrionales bacterium]
MKTSFNIVGFGSKMTDWVIDLKNAERMAFVNDKLKAIDDSLPQLTSAGGHYDVAEMHTALKSIVVENWKYLGAKKAPGGSVYNTSNGAKVAALSMFGQEARKIAFHHIPTSIVTDALVFNMPPSKQGSDNKVVREKYLCANRLPREVKFTSEQIELLADLKTRVVFFPLSTPNGYPEQTNMLLNILEMENSEAKVMATFHGFNAEKNPIKHWPAMNKADAWVGNSKELGHPSNQEARERFAKDENNLQVVTLGENGLQVTKGNFSKTFPGLNNMGEVKGTAGAGNGVEGATLLYLADMFKCSAEENLYALGRLANAAGAAATTFKGTTLRPKHASLIRMGYEYQAVHRMPK